MYYRITDINETRAGISAEITAIGDADESVVLLFKPSLWFDLGLSSGDEIDEGKLSELRHAADFSRAIARAEGMLASSDYSRQRLISRLLHYKLPRDICEECADYMVEHGYIKEDEQARRITKFFCVRKHWGKKRIAAELMGRGYERRVIFAALDTVSDDEYFDSLMSLVEKKYAEPAEGDERQKRIAALSRLGFSFADIDRALRQAEELYKESTVCDD